MGTAIRIKGTDELKVKAAGLYVISRLGGLGRRAHGFKIVKVGSEYIKTIDVCGQRGKLSSPMVRKVFERAEALHGVKIDR